MTGYQHDIKSSYIPYLHIFNHTFICKHAKCKIYKLVSTVLNVMHSLSSKDIKNVRALISTHQFFITSTFIKRNSQILKTRLSKNPNFSAS
jgi:hypothetical protein